MYDIYVLPGVKYLSDAVVSRVYVVGSATQEHPGFMAYQEWIVWLPFKTLLRRLTTKVFNKAFFSSKNQTSGQQNLSLQATRIIQEKQAITQEVVMLNKVS